MLNFEKNKIQILHDSFGNIYFKNMNKIYYLSIGKNNEIEIYETKYNDNKYDNTSYSKIYNNENAMLKKKIMEEFENDDDESGDDDEFANYRNKIKYLPEDKTFVADELPKEKYDDYDGYCDTEDGNFNFYKNNDFEIVNIDGSDVLSIYDTYIFCSDDKIVFSSQYNQSSQYRISIYKNTNILLLNIIGNDVKKYNIVLKDDELQFEKII